VKTTILHSGVFAVLLTGSLHAQNLAATWQGTFEADGERRRVEVQISRAEQPDGWQAQAVHIEYFPDDLSHVDSLAVEGPRLKLVISGGRIAYSGSVTPDGMEIEGNWTWNQHTTPLTLRRATKETAWTVPFLYQYHRKDVTYARPSPAEPKVPFSAGLAATYLEQGTLAWTGERQCVACHTNGSYMVVRPLLTAQLGPPQKEMRDFFVKTLHEELATDPADLRPELDATQPVYVAAGLAIWDAHVTHRLSPETALALETMFKLQREAGDWTISDDNNPPLESSRYQLATVAARAVANAPDWLSRQRGTAVEAKVERLRAYLRAEGKMQGDYDRTDLLWAAAEWPGLLEAGRMRELVEMVLRHQLADGGWSIRTFARPEEWGKGNRAAKLRAEPELENPPSDGHMTGLAIIALRKAGVPARDARIQRGVAWIEANQRASGRWWTRSLNRDGWQFISYSGTAYPMLALALCDALPGTPERPLNAVHDIAAARRSLR
jgi:squalene-hopene/tetraprenyl-beta-curcumene cyclase